MILDIKQTRISLKPSATEALPFAVSLPHLTARKTVAV